VLTFKHIKCRWADESKPLALTIEDTPDGDGILIAAGDYDARAENIVRRRLLEAGRDGVLRTEIREALRAGGIEDTDRAATRVLGKLYAGGKVRKRRDGKAGTRYWWADAAPGEAE